MLRLLKFFNLDIFFLSTITGRLIHSPISFGMLDFVFQFCIITFPFKPENKSPTERLELKIFLFNSFCFIGCKTFL